MSMPRRCSGDVRNEAELLLLQARLALLAQHYEEAAKLSQVRHYHLQLQCQAHSCLVPSLVGNCLLRKAEGR
jgi:hypothetical protein